MSLSQYVALIILYTIVALAQGTRPISERHSDMEAGGNGEDALLDRRKRMGMNDIVSRCWDDIDDSLYALMPRPNCLYISQDEYLCYKFISSGDSQEKEDCGDYTGYGLAEVNSIIILDGIATLARSAGMVTRYWLRVNSPLQNSMTGESSSSSSGECSSYMNDFSLNEGECTYLEIRGNEYKIKKRMCDDVNDDYGFICQVMFEPTRETTTTPLIQILTGNEVSTTEDQVMSEVTFQQQSNEDVSKMPDVVIPISIALAVAVVCIVILVAFILCKRRTMEQDKHDPPKTHVNELEYADKKDGDNSSNLNPYSKYGTSLPGDYACLSDSAPKNKPDYISKEENVYDVQYEYPMLPLPAEKANTETLLTDPSYDSLGPHYDVLNRNQGPVVCRKIQDDPPKSHVNGLEYADKNVGDNKYGTSLPEDYACLSDSAIEGDVYDVQYEYPMLPLPDEKANTETLLSDPSYDSLGPHYDVLNREEDEDQGSVVYLEIENEK